jgi:hypothetical protein
MNDDIDFSLMDTPNYLESLLRGRKHVENSPLLAKLDEVIELEIELALLSAEKAKSEHLKDAAKVTPLKGI